MTEYFSWLIIWLLVYHLAQIRGNTSIFSYTISNEPWLWIYCTIMLIIFCIVYHFLYCLSFLVLLTISCIAYHFCIVYHFFLPFFVLFIISCIAYHLYCLPSKTRGMLISRSRTVEPLFPDLVIDGSVV